MLLRFRAANVLSFREELDLSLVATEFNEGTAMPAGFRSDGRDVAFLPVIAIYGANASGKTNVLSALRWARRAVLDSVEGWSKGTGVPREPFALDPAARNESTLLEVDLVLSGIRHVYGFEVSGERVETEWLHVYPHGRRQVWFERDAQAGAEGWMRFPGEGLKGPRTELLTLTRPNALFLTVAASFNHPQLSPVHRWFAENLWFANPRPDEPRRHAFTRRLLGEPSMRGRIESLLRAADLGVLSIEVQERDGGLPRIRLGHRTSSDPVMLDFDRESQGTQAWLALLGPLLSALDNGSVLLVDELDSSLHPVLVAETIRLFNDPDANPHGAQLICTLQDVTLLGSVHATRPLDRDQVWLTTKGRMGESELYPLTDARPRKEESLERGYLRGRYGGIPRVVTGGVASVAIARSEAAEE